MPDHEAPESVVPGELVGMFEVSPLDQTLESIARRACSLLSADASLVLVETQRGRSTGLCATHNLSDEYLRIMGETFVEVSEDVINTNSYRLIGDLEHFLLNRRNDRALRWTKKNGFCSMLCAPVTVAESAVGAVHLYYKKPRHVSKSYEELLTAFSKLSGVAAANARYYERSQHQIAELSVLNQIGQSIGSSLHLDKLLELIYEQASKIMDTSNFYIALYNDRRKEISFEFVVDDWKRIPWNKRKLGSGLTEWIIRNRKPLLITRSVHEYAKQLGILPIGKPAKSWMGVPLIAGGKVLGVMAVQSYDEEAAYDAGHLNVFLTIANQAAAALENAGLYQKMKTLALTDGLTGVFNSRHFRKLLARETARVDRYGGCTSLAIIDLDKFKHYNDKYGHQAGDSLLKRFASELVRNFREVDIVARYGGDEFIAMLPATTREDALTACRRVTALVKASLSGSAKRQGPSLSIGIATCPDDATTAEELVYAADMALYSAKKQGRNRICQATPKKTRGKASRTGGGKARRRRKLAAWADRKDTHPEKAGTKKTK
jgi:diguanylate cyclase (GGDEF)-like protein